MFSGSPTLAASCHASSAGLLGATDELRDLVDVAVAGFTDHVLAIRGFGDPAPLERSVQLLAHAQAIAGGTRLEPAVAWGLAQLDRVAGRRSSRRMLVILTDAELTFWDAQASALRVSAADEGIASIAIGLGDVNERVLRSVVPATLVLRPDQTAQLPILLQRLVENVVHEGPAIM